MFTKTNQADDKSLQVSLRNSLNIIRNYDWLIDSYVLDFYADNHWSKLPNAWKETFENANPDDLSDLLEDFSDSGYKKVWPLSVLALKASFARLCVDRKVLREDPQITSAILLHPKLKNIFTNSVKPKKRHEVERMAQLTSESCLAAGVRHVVDFGAGLGHLARVLAYGYGLRVCCLEMQNGLNQQGRQIDLNLEKMANKHLPAEAVSSLPRPVHVTLKLTESVTPSDFLNQIRAAFGIPDEEFSFGIIGLHPCGDLGAILIRMFLQCPGARFLNLAGCCYMKLSPSGYPLSNFMNELPPAVSVLSYESREISCHAMETYAERLRNGIYDNLKVHSFRAALEDVIARNWPQRRRSGVRSVKHTKDMTFEEYCQKAFQNLYVEEIPQADLHSPRTLENLARWKQVVIFYTLRLMFAPLIESVVLYDRVLFLKENACHTQINAIFNPQLSPRNHITTAIKPTKRK